MFHRGKMRSKNLFRRFWDKVVGFVDRLFPWNADAGLNLPDDGEVVFKEEWLEDP